MLFKKLWRTMGVYKSQFISMIVMIALGVGIFVSFNMEWVSLEKNVGRILDETGFSDFHIISQDGLSADDLDKVLKVDGVEKAARYISVTVDVKGDEGNSVALNVTTDENVSGVLLVDGEKYDAQSKDGIWLSDKYAEKNNVKIGDKFTVTYKSIEISGTVKGLIKSGENLICVRDESQLMPDYTTHGYAYISPVMYKQAVGMDYYPQINVISDMDKKDFTSKIDDVLGSTMLVVSRDENAIYSSYRGEVEEGQTMGSVLPVLFLLIAVLTMVTTMHRLTAKEKVQIGTLKALGFKDTRIMRHYTSYAFMIGAIGIVFGIGLGYLVAGLLMSESGTMGTYFDMPYWHLYMPWFGYVVLALILLSLTFIGFLSVKSMLKGTAADALRAYTPKKMKALLIERTKWFHKLSFGTRWNMRDIMRHKSRTAMSLIGVLGCTILVVGSLGMRDTMNSFLSLYYDEATNYASRIYLAETATEQQRDDIIKQYNGDWSSSLSVQIEEKAVELDVYNVENDLVRFPDKDNNYIDLSDDGAYICMRLAKEFGLDVGDTFSVSPYGSDEKYTLTVAGIARSVAENIVITPAYAEKLGIDFVADSVYTTTEKSAIGASDSIKSIQSKQMIMDSFDSFMGLMNLMIVLLVGGALVLGIVVLYNLGVMSYTERYREMATLKVVGFKDGKIGKLLIGQNLWISVFGIIIGLPLGFLTLSYLLEKLASEYEMKAYVGPVTYIVSIVLTLGVSLIVGLMVARKNKHIDMVEALKCAE